MALAAVISQLGWGYNGPVSDTIKNRVMLGPLCLLAILLVAAELNLFGLANIIREYGRSILCILVFACALFFWLLLNSSSRTRADDSSGQTSR